MLTCCSVRVDVGKEVFVGSSKKLGQIASSTNLTPLPQGEGLFRSGHSFNVNSEVGTEYGKRYTRKCDAISET